LKGVKGLSFYIIIFVLMMLALTMFNNFGNSSDMKYSDFRTQLQAKNIKAVYIRVSDADVVLAETKGIYEKDMRYKVRILSQDVFFADLINAADKGLISSYDVEKESGIPGWFWLEIISLLVMVGVFIFIWVFFMQQSQGGGNRVMSFGKSRARVANEDGKMKVRFDDVAGADEEKEELKEVVDFLKDPRKFVELGARIPKGVLLVGPPGTGKTLLGKAVAGEAGVPFYSISGSDFVEMFVGVGASRVRDLFETAKKNAPSIVFIDEIDAVGRHRGAGMGGGHDEREQTLNQLLVEMDGFGVNEGVIILAATNRPDILDPALMRPGRFDRRVTVGYPDVKGREAILRVHAKGKPFSLDVDLKEIAKITPYFTGADLENLLNESAIMAARRNKKTISMDEIKESTFKVMIGPEKKSRVMNEQEKKLTAYHEAGHALAIRVASTTDKVDRVSIIPSGKAGGYTVHKPDEDISYQTRTHLLEGIVVALGGRAAEEMVLGEISTGAYGDLKQANNIARSMITKYGMSEELGNLFFSDDDDEVFLGKSYGHMHTYSEDVSAKIDAEVKKIIDNSYDRVKQIIGDNLGKLHDIAKALLERERLEGFEFEEVFNNGFTPMIVQPVV
jgi:cell division protease FtsH